MPVDGQERRPQPGRRHRDLEELEAVRQNGHDRMAGLGAHAVEDGRQPVGPVVELGERERLVAQHERVLCVHTRKLA